ncbi:MAG: hypothetical protein R3300_03515 [Candidatus Promineifilaceae bacterium]|nr:hypothetical protein [Candidatus Promineifilaceae bacterium]
MFELSLKTESSGFKIGWGVLLFLAVSNVLGHIGLLIFEPEPTSIFVAWAALNLLATTILLIPYKRHERWAWYAIWLLILPYGLIVFFNAEIGPIYMSEAVVMTIGQLLTFSSFAAGQ